MRDPRPRVVVAGIGNIFFGDDAFGVAVAQHLLAGPLPDGVRVVDVGVRTLHLAYELAATPCDTLILVDAMPRRGAPGTVYVLEPDNLDPATAAVDAHGARPEDIRALLRAIGAEHCIRRTIIVGCEPAIIDEAAEMSDCVRAAVAEAARLVLCIAERS
ncbi:MAG TPA: hydrogenase maturation protease [Gemmatimonadaceae bacterium]|nr:hydrogenase maturation protease [Gemmatimonadaceae bacterium]